MHLLAYHSLILPVTLNQGAEAKSDRVASGVFPIPGGSAPRCPKQKSHLRLKIQLAICQTFPKRAPVASNPLQNHIFELPIA